MNDLDRIIKHCALCKTSIRLTDCYPCLIDQVNNFDLDSDRAAGKTDEQMEAIIRECKIRKRWRE